MFDSSVLRRILGPKSEETRGGLKKLHNKELNNWYSSPDIIRLIKSRTIKLTGVGSRHGREERCINSLSREIYKKETAWKTYV
jgi:hypothetical protein